MQAATIQRRIDSPPTLSRSGKRINGLHRLLRSPYLFERAYERVSRNKGALTPGVDGKTFDNMSLEKLADIARRVAEGTYRFRPVRRVYTPKDDGKTRPLGIPKSPSDLIDRLKAHQCEGCGDTTGPFQMHHPRRVQDLRSGSLTVWKQSGWRRKTIVLSPSCHAAVSGRKQTHVESRVH